MSDKIEFKAPDLTVVLIYMALVAIGWMSIYSTQNDSATAIFDFYNLSKKHGTQLLWAMIALLTAVAVMIISKRFYPVFANHMYVAAIFLLLLTLVIGTEIKSSKSWLNIGIIRFQPSELAKLATSLALARLLGLHEFKLNSLLNWLKTIAIIVLPMGLILLQKDWGSALVFVSFFFVLYRQGMSGWVLTFMAFTIALFIFSLLFPLIWIISGIALASILLIWMTYHRNKQMLIRISAFGAASFAAGIIYKYAAGSDIEYDKLIAAAVGAAVVGNIVFCLLWRKKVKRFVAIFFFCSTALVYSVDYVYDNVLQPHHRSRIEDMLGIKEDKKNAGYNVYQSKIAIGSGGLTGKGFLHGTQTKLNFVPEQSTDFIFCTIGEEWGFAGSFTVVALFVTLFIRLIVLAERQKTPFSKIYGYCVVSIMFFHFAINIAMTIGLAPVIGIPLPFISAGGSSLWSFTVLLFIFLKLDSTNK
ncbi:MAG: rod shape-determining protein RodA [Prevotellaceae bacterium]|jgi:rod shape determining protein RodA|nr:rod shape-determining protein RodA [Prevotellaceae bacterium]